MKEKDIKSPEMSFIENGERIKKLLNEKGHTNMKACQLKIVN